MIESLIILDKIDDSVKEGFLRIDRDKTVTVAFTGNEGRYMWCIGNRIGEFNKNRAVIRSVTPKDAGIFRIENDKAYPVLIHGSKPSLEAAFKKLTGLEIGKPENDKITEEAIIKEPEYKETGYTVPDDFLPVPDEIPETFWDCNKGKFTSFLEDNPPNEALSMLIPGSRWVDVATENYTFGVIYDEGGMPLYVAYGFKLGYSDDPPESLEGYSQWIPTDTSDPHGDGFWVIYINASTGERIQ